MQILSGSIGEGKLGSVFPVLGGFIFTRVNFSTGYVDDVAIKFYVIRVAIFIIVSNWNSHLIDLSFPRAGMIAGFDETKFIALLSIRKLH